MSQPERRDSSTMDADELRVAEIEQMFEVMGWQLHLHEVDGAWEASFGIAEVTIGPTLPPPEAHAATRLEAAEAAWAKSQHEPWLGVGGDRPA